MLEPGQLAEINEASYGGEYLYGGGEGRFVMDQRETLPWRNGGNGRWTLRSARKPRFVRFLNEFLYLGFKDAGENDTLADIIAAIESNPKKYESFIKKDEFTILKANLDRIGDYQIGNQSWNLSQFNSGTGACTFTDPDSGKIYVVYRCGTGDGEWLDNGLGMTQASTLPAGGGGPLFRCGGAQRPEWL